MKKITAVCLVIILTILLYSCKNASTNKTGASSEKKQLQDTIRELETKMHTSASLDVTIGKSAVHEYLRYAGLYPDDSLSAFYLFKGGEVATAVQEYTNALHCYQLITERYPSFGYARESLYLQGFLFDNFLNDDDKAKVVYVQFLQKYSTGNYVEDAKAAIANLGKSDEELIKEFEKKNRN
jgi:hypothetical protein